jgi:diguanylate cyclase (GGDEF)-like protein
MVSGSGAVGMVVCGDVSRPRTWSGRERAVARQLALEGALVVDSARLRQSERAHLEELRHRADHDVLTGLPNRARLLAAIEAAVPSPGGGGLLILDLDGFKQVNDTLGHHAGDELLREVARRLRREVRAEDLAARLGGDEFAVLLSGTTREEALELADRLRAAIGEPVVVEGVRTRVGVSIGTAALADHAQDVTGLLRAADAAMYASKRGLRHRPR